MIIIYDCSKRGGVISIGVEITLNRAINELVNVGVMIAKKYYILYDVVFSLFNISH